MERSVWLRLGTVGATVLFCVWALVPTYLHQQDLAASEGDSELGSGPIEREGELEVWFDATDGTADAATVPAVEARLAAAGIDPDLVRVEGPRLIVAMKVGTRKEQVAAALDASGPALKVYGPDAFGVDAAALALLPPDQVDLAVRSALAQPVAVDAPALAISVVGAPQVSVDSDGGSVSLTLDSKPVAGVDPLVITSGGRALAYVRADATPGPFEPVLLTSAADPAWSGPAPLPEPLVRHVAAELPDEVEAEDTDGDTDAPEVTGARAWLPPWQINLGLDLQGGIDLTLQVDQDAAVDAAVLRDRRMLTDAAAKDSKAVTVERERARPAVRVSTELPFDELKTWMSEKLGNDYAYVDTEEDAGVSWYVWEMNAVRENAIREQAVEQNLETIRKRVDSTGVKEPSIVQMGGGRINIAMPGVRDARSALDAVGRQATLEFRMVDDELGQFGVADLASKAESALPDEQLDNPDLLNDWLRTQGLLKPGKRLMYEYTDVKGKPTRVRPVLVADDILLTGGDVEAAQVSFDETNQPNVALSFKPRGAQVFCDVTTKNVGKPFAIILDDEVRSAPVIQTSICGGQASISMGNTGTALDDANALALVLRSGALTAPVDIGSVSQVGASLGEDAIRSSVYAALIGAALVFSFMIVWYRMAGMMANITLLINVLLVLTLMAMNSATLTLPGIAGIALTVGMAVDANIIFYERIREELMIGTKPTRAVEEGFKMGLPAIIDANVTTGIAGVVLFSYGSGPIKGFAVTMLIGIFTTMITSVFVSRTLMDAYVRDHTRIRM